MPSQEERQYAQATLTYIRETMESASSFTAVSGWGLIAVGAIGSATAWLAWSTGAETSLGLWVPAALVAVAVSGVLNAAKARRIGVPLWSGSLRKVAWVMLPALTAGGMLTYAIAMEGNQQLLPGTWLALYGAGVTAGGTFSIRAIRWMGLALLGLGGLALYAPSGGLLFLALGFGALHLAFGAYITGRHGG